MTTHEESATSDHMDARLAEIEKIVSNSAHMGPYKRNLHIDDTTFNKDDPQIKEDILRMIIQHLQDEGYMGSVMTLQDESNVRQTEQITKINHMKKMKKSILEGDWAEVEKLSAKQTFKTQQSFLYAVYKQAYLELLERQEYQKAFTYLTKRLKPLESRQTNIDEFRDLCYLLTCKSVQDVPNFKNWDGGKGSSREKLVEQYQSMLEFDNTKSAGVKIPPTRLLTLMRQAVAYQIEFSRYHPKVVPKIKTLLEDYHAFILPNALKNTFTSHKRNVKCLCFVGEEGLHLASGSSDNTVKLWRSEDGANVGTLTGHAARIWDISSNNSGNLLASAAGDGEVRVWDIKSMDKASSSLALRVHEGDAYTVQFHPGQNHIVTGGYDKTVRLIDVVTGDTIKTFTGHNSSVSKTIFNPHGNLIISGSKDSTIKFWDIVSGLCIKTFSSHLGEVTSVDINSAGSLLLSGSKDNSNRLWDIRTDGYVYIWDVETATILQRLKGHSDMVYSAIWNQSQSLLASCSHDNTLKTWWYDPEMPVYVDSNE